MSSGTDPADLHAATQQRVGYKTSDLRWGDEGLAIVLDRSGQQLLVVPIQYLRQGIVNNFAYILRCIHWAYVVSGGHIRNEQGIALNALDAVTPGRFVYWNDETALCRPRIGPRFKFKSRAPHPVDENSTMSHSSRSSANQSTFRFEVAVRDGRCLISEVGHAICTPAHILPVSRPEYYAEVLGYQPSSLYQARFGLFLQGELHHSFDRGHVALYPLMNAEKDLVVHIFYPEQSSYKAYHGKVIRPRDRFRSEPDEWPDQQMLLFHYQQCVIRCLRGWSHF